jgi:hypothetical protein
MKKVEKEKKKSNKGKAERGKGTDMKIGIIRINCKGLANRVEKAIKYVIK